MSSDASSEETGTGKEEAAPAGGMEAVHPVFRFIHVVRGLLDHEFLKNHVRVTPQGLFVSEAGVEKVLHSYQQWLDRESGGEVHKSVQKCMKRLFGSLEPEARYLLEGQSCLKGFLAPAEVRDFQKPGLPYFLGSLSSGRDYIHPRDPALLAISNLEVLQPASGSLEFRLKSGQSVFSFNASSLSQFLKVAEDSPRLSKEFPGIGKTLLDSVKALSTVLKKSRPSGEKHEIVVPFLFSDQKKWQYRTFGSVVLVFSKDGRLQKVYDLRGKSFFYFLRSEFAAIKPRRIGTFEVFSERERALGCFHIGRSKVFLSPRAFLEFAEALPSSPEKRDPFGRKFIVKECFEKFSSTFQTAQPIERSRISGHTEFLDRKPRQFKINGAWIFVLGKDGLIENCIAKHLKKSR